MKKFCTECGKELSKNTMFCTECGSPVSKDTVKPVEKSQEISVNTMPVVQAPQPIVAESKVVGTGMYFGLMFLFSLPIIGFIVCIIMAITAKNKNLKNFAKAVLIWTVIAFVISAILVAIVVMLGNAFTSYITSGETGSQLNEFSSIFGELNEYNEIMNEFQNGGFETLPTQ